MRTFGIEEEYSLIDHATCRPSTVVPALHRELLQVNVPGTTLDMELMASQIEVVTEICSERAQALQALFERRQVLSEICARHGYRLIAAGTPPCLPEARLVSASPRYQQLQKFVPAIVRDHFVSGLHVRIGIDSPRHGGADDEPPASLSAAAGRGGGKFSVVGRDLFWFRSMAND